MNRVAIAGVVMAAALAGVAAGWGWRPAAAPPALGAALAPADTDVAALRAALEGLSARIERLEADVRARVEVRVDGEGAAPAGVAGESRDRLADRVAALEAAARASPAAPVALPASGSGTAGDTPAVAALASPDAMRARLTQLDVRPEDLNPERLAGDKWDWGLRPYWREQLALLEAILGAAPEGAGARGYFAALVELLVSAKQFDAAADALDRHGVRIGLPDWQCDLIRAAIASQSHVPARQLVALDAALARPSLPPKEREWASWRLADVHVGLQHPEAAERILLEQADRQAAGDAAAVEQSWGWRWRAAQAFESVGRLDEALARFRGLASAAAAAGCTPIAWRARQGAVRCLVAVGPIAEAREALRAFRAEVVAEQQSLGAALRAAAAATAGSQDKDALKRDAQVLQVLGWAQSEFEALQSKLDARR